MKFSKVCIEALGYCLPDQVLTSLDIENRLSKVYELFGISKGKLEAITGIQERRVWPVGTKPSTIAAEAAEKALSQSQFDKPEIDLLIHTGVCRDALEPSTAAVVHNTLKLSPHCQVFDISNACIGFLNGMLIAANLIELGQVKNALVVTGENAGPIYQDSIDLINQDPSLKTYEQRLAGLTLGSAGAAMILSHQDIVSKKDCPKLLGGLTQTDSSGHALCQGQGNPHNQSMITDTRNLMKNGLNLVKITWELFKREMEWQNDCANHFLIHQISRSHFENFFSKLELDQAKGHPYLSTLGNTGSAAAPLALMLSAEKQLFKKGENLALLGIGSGIVTAMLGIQW